MNDIVDRLRDVAGFIQKEYGRVSAAACLATEAADLIKSLREKTQYWPDNAERDAVIRYQKEEIERLRAAIKYNATMYLEGLDVTSVKLDVSDCDGRIAADQPAQPQEEA